MPLVVVVHAHNMQFWATNVYRRFGIFLDKDFWMGVGIVAELGKT